MNSTLKELGVRKSAFYEWHNAYLKEGYDGIANKPCMRIQNWNQLPEEEKQGIVELALELPDRSPIEVACLFTDIHKRHGSESPAYRILRERGLIAMPAFTLTQASDEFKDKTGRVNEMWQTDFTYFKIPCWACYYLNTEAAISQKLFDSWNRNNPDYYRLTKLSIVTKRIYYLYNSNGLKSAMAYTTIVFGPISILKTGLHLETLLERWCWAFKMRPTAILHVEFTARLATNKEI